MYENVSATQDKNEDVTNAYDDVVDADVIEEDVA